MISPDRGIIRPLEQAKQLIERDRIPDAVELIGTVLQKDDDFFLDSSDPRDRTTGRTFKQSVEELLRSLPEEGKRLYATENEPLARRLLLNAVQSGSVESLEKLVDGWFYTDAGKDAAFLLALHHFDQGTRGSCALLLRRIVRESPSVDSYEPTLSLTLASCERQLGNEKAASEILDQFLRRFPNPRIVLAGNELWNPRSSREMLDRLGSWTTEPNTADWLEQTGWLLPEGQPDMNPRSDASPPLLDLLWKLPVLSQSKSAAVVRILEGKLRYENESRLPVGRPLVVAPFFIYRGYDGLVAVDSRTGKRVWIGKEIDFRKPISATTFLYDHPLAVQNASQWIASILRLNLWYNRTRGILSSDGTLVYSIENEPGIPNGRFGQGGMMFRQGKQMEDPQQRISTTLVARKVSDGEIAWTVGKAPLVQKLYDRIEEQLKEDHEKEKKNRENAPRIPGVAPRPPGPGIPVPALPFPAVPGIGPRIPLGIAPPLNVRPVPINPVPPKPAPINPVPINPVPINPAPINPVPINPAPINPVPINPVPINPVPVKPVPANSTLETESAFSDQPSVPLTPLVLKKPSGLVAFQQEEPNDENSKQTNSEQATSKQATSKQATSKQTNSEQTNSEQTNSEQTNSKQANSEQTNSEQTEQEEKEAGEDRPKSIIEITEEEQFLGDTYFLGPPLPLKGNLYVLGEYAGTIRLFIFESKTGRLIRHLGLIAPSQPIESDLTRRLLGPTPSFAEGILVCPTAAGALVALDASSGKLLWCYTYTDRPEESVEAGQPQMRRGIDRHFLRNFSGSNEEFRRLSEQLGWSVPSAMIVRGKVIFAPADKPTLYCIDLLTGREIWKKDRGTAKYVATVHGEKVILVGTGTLVALDLETGKGIWDDAELSDIAGLSDAPSRQGAGRIELFPPRNPRMLPIPTNTKRDTASKSPAKDEEHSLPRIAFPEGTSPSGVGFRYGNSYLIPMKNQSVCVYDLNSGSLLRQMKSIDGTPLGHLLANGGKIYSQTAGNVACFYQMESLRTRSEERLKQEPDDVNALLELGRLARAEAKPDDALSLFRRAIAIQSTPKARELLCSLYAELFETNFSKYRISLEEIERIATTPESRGTLLHSLALGAARTKDFPSWAVAIRKLVEEDRAHHLMKRLAGSERVLLSRWIGEQIRTYKNEPGIASMLDSFADEEFRRIVNERNGTNERISREWKSFLEYFGALSVSDRARNELFQLLKQKCRLSEMEFLCANSDDFQRVSKAGFSFDSSPNTTSDTASDTTSNATSNAVSQISADTHSSITSDTTSNTSSHISSRISSDHLGKAERLFQLARELEKAGEIEEAFYYYNILGTSFPKVILSGKPSVPDTPQQNATKSASKKDDDSLSGLEVFRRIAENPVYSKFLQQKIWPDGKVVFSVQDKEPTPDGENRNLTPFGNSGPFPNLPQHFESPIPLMGRSSPFFDDCSFSLGPNARKTPRLVCRDATGTIKWTLDLPEQDPGDFDPSSFSMQYQYQYQEFVYSNQNGFLKSYNHLLFFIRGKNIFAIDTLAKDREGRVKILWSKAARNPLGQVRAPVGAMMLRNFFAYRMGNNDWNDPVFINSSVVCFHDMDTLQGVDPLSGKLLWVRDFFASQVFITGNERNLFLLRPMENPSETTPRLRSGYAPSSRLRFEAAVLDGSTGEELLNERLPDGMVQCLGTKIVCIGTYSQQTGASQIAVFDLEDLFSLESLRKSEQENWRKKAASTNPDDLRSNGVGFAGTLLQPRWKSRTPIAYESVLGVFESGRVLAILEPNDATGKKGNLQLIDLESFKPIVPPMEFPERTGISGTRPARAANQRNSGNLRNPMNRIEDVYVEIDHDGVLVLFVNDRNVNQQSSSGSRILGSSRRSQNRGNPIGIPAKGIGRGFVMRFDKQGKPVWKEPVPIEHWFFFEGKKKFPVLLFGASVYEEGNNVRRLYPVVWGLDKRSGKRRFSEKFIDETPDRNHNGQMNGFRIFADPDNNRMEFLASRWTIIATFMEETEADKQRESDADREKATRSDETLSRMFRAMQDAVLPEPLRKELSEALEDNDWDSIIP